MCLICENISNKISRLFKKNTIESKNNKLLYVPDKWDMRFLNLAEHIAQWSKDPSTQVGAVITDKRRIISLGYNGFPQGVDDTDERLNNRELKYKMIIHGEINAILFARESLFGHTLYTWPFMPCPVCASIVAQTGIKRVVAPHTEDSRRDDYYKVGLKTFEEASVRVDLVDISHIKKE